MAAGFLLALLEKGGHDGDRDDRLLVPLAVTGLCVLGGMYAELACIHATCVRINCSTQKKCAVRLPGIRTLSS